MSSKFHQLEVVHDDSVYLVVGEHDVADFPDRATARAFLLQLASRGSHLELEWLAAEFSTVPPRSLEEAVEILADAIASGTLVAVRHHADARLLDDEMEDIEDLVDPSARDEPWIPIDPRPVEPDLTWLSFEVMDDRGHRLDGGYVCTIDARPEEGPLAKEKHHYPDLRHGAQAELELRFLDLFQVDEADADDADSDAGRDSDAITPAPTDDSRSPGPDTATSFEVVDNGDAPLAGDYIVFHEGREVVSGPLSGRTELDPGLEGPLTLELHFVPGARIDGSRSA